MQALKRNNIRDYHKLDKRNAQRNIKKRDFEIDPQLLSLCVFVRILYHVILVCVRASSVPSAPVQMCGHVDLLWQRP